MPKLWLGISLASLLLGLIVYLDQELRTSSSWSWHQLRSHEALVGIAVSLGITLLVVAVIEYMRNRRVAGGKVMNRAEGNHKGEAP